MFAFSSALKIFLAVAPVDMRNHFNGLWALAVQQLQEDPRGGALFVFTNKRRDRLKVLLWDGTGAWVMAKRLEKGRFSWPENRSGVKLALSAEALTMLVSGIDLRAGCRKAWYEAK